MPNSKAAVLHGEIRNLFRDLALIGAFPVGFIWSSTENTNPRAYLGGGTWEAMPSTEPGVYRFKRTA